MCTALRIPTGRHKDWRDITIGEKIPVAKRDRSLTWVTWGRERGDAGGRLWPPGGWVPHDTIKAGKWWRLNPRPVVIPCVSFRIRSFEFGSRGDHWCNLEEFKAIQGALCTREGEQRIYLVTVFEEFYKTKVWPRLIGYPTMLVKWEFSPGGPEEMFPDEMD